MSNTTTTRTRRHILTRGLLAAAAVTGAAAVAGVGPASADTINTVPLDPGQSYCVGQSANYQVRGDGWATGGGARFKLLQYSNVLEATPGRVTNWAAERRSSYGNFPGAGYYSVCAYNTGTSRTTVTVRIRTDAEFS